MGGRYRMDVALLRRKKRRNRVRYDRLPTVAKPHALERVIFAQRADCALHCCVS